MVCPLGQPDDELETKTVIKKCPFCSLPFSGGQNICCNDRCFTGRTISLLSSLVSLLTPLRNRFGAVTRPPRVLSYARINLGVFLTLWRTFYVAINLSFSRSITRKVFSFIGLLSFLGHGRFGRIPVAQELNCYFLWCTKLFPSSYLH